MATYIDLEGLAPTADIGRSYADALNLGGMMVEKEYRLEVLFNRLKDGDVVLTGPGGHDFWLMAPPSVMVRIVPDNIEVGRDKRADSVLEWQCRLRGVSRAQAKQWAKKGPTKRHSQYAVFKEALVEADLIEARRLGTGEVAKWEPSEIGSPEVETPYKWTCILDPTTYVDLIDRLSFAVEKGTTIGLDVEADTEGDPDPRRDKLVGIGFSFGEEHNYYLPLNGPLNREAALDGIRPYMERLIWVGWNASYDALVARNAGLPLRAAAGDGQCAAMVLQRKSRRLKDTTYELYEYRMETFKELIQEFGVKLISMVPLIRAAKYCCGDAYFGLRATKDLEGRLDSETSRQLYFEIEMPVHDILIRMTEVGLPLDVAGVEKLKEKYDEKLDAITQAIRDEVDDQEFNPNADRQIARVLFDELGLPVQRLTPTKQRSTGEMTLLKLKPQAPYLITLLLQWKHYDKIRGTYLIPWLKKHRNGRLQILWKQYRTSTGRLASEDPNAQNIPLDLRQFIAGNLAVADYSQLEMRIAGWLSGEQRLVDVFRRGEDVHDLTCQLIFGLKPGESKERPAIRVAAKAVNFAGKLYGAWGAKVQELVEREALRNPELDIRIPTIDEASAWIKEDQKAYPDFQKWKRWLIDSTRERGYSLTAYGRMRVLPDITSEDPERRAAAEREAVSLAIQGTAADLCKMAMLRVDVIPGGVIIIQNHDEIVSEVLLETPGEQMEYALTMGKEMELGQPLVGKFAVPLVVEPKLVHNWKEAK